MSPAPAAADKPPAAAGSLGVTLRSLEIFASAVEEGTLSGAAARLGLTHSAVSQAVAGLEQTLGARLFDRSVRPPTLTLQGQAALRHALRVLDEARQLEAGMRLHGAQQRLPLLRIGILDSFASLCGAAVLDQLRDLAEKWTVASGIQATSFQALLDRRSDVVITANETHVPSGVEAVALLREPFVLVVPASWPGQVQSLRKLSAELDFIRYSRNVQIKALIATWLERAGIDPPNRFEFDTTDAALRMVAGGFGWTIGTPLIFLKSMTPTGSLRVLPLPGPRVTRELVVAVRRGEGQGIAERVRDAALQNLESTVLPRIAGALPQFAREVQLLQPAARRAPRRIPQPKAEVAP